MLNHINEVRVLEVKGDVVNPPLNEGLSFKKKRKVRRITRLKIHLEKSLTLKKENHIPSLRESPSTGPTKETKAKLTLDPLLILRRYNILNNQQIWVFKEIRRAVMIITDGTQVRISRYDDVMVQTSRHGQQPEADFEIKIKEKYNDWIDQMTKERRPVGPILDIIIDELSLSAIDRKWGKRKGWAKGYLQVALDLY